MGLMKTVLTSCLSVLLASNSYSAWQGPNELITGSWGTEGGDFGIEHGDTSDRLPWLTAVTSDGKVVISDKTNEREVVYNSDGTLFKVVPWHVMKDGSKTVNPEYPLYKYWDVQGYTPEGNIWIKIDKYFLKSPKGQRLSTTTERPAELGRVTEKPVSSNKAKVTVQYPDRTWSYIDVGRQPSYLRDKSGNLYGYGDTQAIKYTTCGKEAASLMMPKKIEQEESRGPQIEPKVTVLEEYGPPVIAPNGDVYTWKRTPDKYSILKWTWVEDPNPPANVPDAPEKLIVKPTSKGINLFWQIVPQDPGCVTGYEIVRATTAGGPYATFATVNAGTANAAGTIRYTDTATESGTTYYYKVRAAAGTEYSPYSADVSGKR